MTVGISVFIFLAHLRDITLPPQSIWGLRSILTAWHLKMGPTCPEM